LVNLCFQLFLYQDNLYWVQKAPRRQGFMGIEKKKPSILYCAKTEAKMG